MNSLDPISALLQLIAERQSFLVTSHARPDGDAIGSALGLMYLLEGLGKQVEVVLADPIPVLYRKLPGADRITSSLPAIAPDALILLECDSRTRTGFADSAFEAMGPTFTINIDHHLSGREFADFNWIDAACCAVGGLIYNLAVASGAEINRAMATCLYTAVLTDTGCFTYVATVASTFALAQHLVERGANANCIAQAIYFSNPVSKIKLLGVALRNLQTADSFAWASITLEDMASVGANVEGSEGIVNYLIGIEGVEAAFFLRELPGDAGFRLSLRSKAFLDVARVAEKFGGGGHRSASGCTISGSLASVTDTILAELRAETLLA